MSRPRIPAALLALLVSACSLVGADETGDTDVATGDEATSVPTGGPPPCGQSTDCPPPDPCELVACDAGACVYTPRDEGDIVAGEPGDCMALVCDGDGAGAPQTDLDDVPDDGVACTDDVCDDGPANLPLPAGSTCNGTMVCHADLTCHPCPATDGCADTSPAEPNETMPQAAHLPQVRDDADPAYLCEVLGSPGDVDWFTFTTVDTNLGTVDPSVDPSSSDLLVCIYFQCQTGGTNVACPDGTVDDDAPLGMQGCCGHGAFAPTIDCNGFDEDATVWLQIRHDADDPPACQNYQLAYTY